MCERTSLVLFCLPLFVALLLDSACIAQEQLVDPDYKPTVERPAYPERGPTVAIDEAHENFHTASGRYRPFADLLGRDGYIVRTSASKFELDALKGIEVLVIANALPGDSLDETQPAFTEEECDVVQEWVQAGGSLLLIADHAPFGSAAETLAKRFGVTMGKGWAFDRADGEGVTTKLVFSDENGLLGTHSIIMGRSSAEEVSVVRTFTGQSLGIPEAATALLSFSTNAREAMTAEDVNAEDAAARSVNGGLESPGAHSTSIASRAQGVALQFGSGRVVMLGEAGFLSAQLIRWPDGREVRFGMNVPGTDNQQFGLNVMHWLSRLLE